MGRDGDPGGLSTISKDPKLQAAKIRLLDGTFKDFELHRGSDGEALFALVSADLSIEEREYFSLCFYDCEGTRHWLYNDKKILRQLKGLPWEFCFEVKFYPTTPSSLNGDHARYNLFLQLRNDVCTGRLPATMDTLATLGSLATQAEFGDAKPTAEYERYLKSTKFAPQNSEQLIEMIAVKHKDHKGLTPAEAENLYMDKCKEQSMYGIFVFNAKDNRNVPVGIGICAHGIYIYKDQIRVNRFPWQGIIKISYRKNQFAIKLKPGEIEKKETTVVYKVVDYQHAKRIWKCAVEHHTFFRLVLFSDSLRLIQPDEKPRSSLFRWGSAGFRYQGRTQFQTKMASQMFDKPAESALQRDSNARLTHSLDNVAREQVISGHVSPLHYADNELGSREPMASPAACYDVSGQSEKRKLADKVGHDLQSNSDEDDELVYTPIDSPLSAAYYLSGYSSACSPTSDEVNALQQIKLKQSHISGFRSYKDYPQSANPVNIQSLKDYSLSVGQSNSFSQNNMDVSTKHSDMEQLPNDDYDQLYHTGYSLNCSQPRVERRNLDHSNNQINGITTVQQVYPSVELSHHPIRYFVNVKHSGYSFIPRVQRVRHSGPVETGAAEPHNYVFNIFSSAPLERLEPNQELPGTNIRQHSLVYHTGDSHLLHTINSNENITPIKLVARVFPTISQKKNSRKNIVICDEQSNSMVSKNSSKIRLCKDKNLELSQLSESQRSENYKQPVSIADKLKRLKSQTSDHTDVQHKTTLSKRIDSNSLNGHRLQSSLCYNNDIVKQSDTRGQARPEIYGVASTSYDGPLELTSRHSDLISTPIENHAKLYHSGQSWNTYGVKKSTESPFKTEQKKNKATMLHLKTSPTKMNQSHESDDETPKVRLIARVPHRTTENDLDGNKLKKSGDSSRFSGFKKTGSSHKHTEDSLKLSSYPSSDKYVGPLDEINRRDDIEQLPFISPTPVAYQLGTDHSMTTHKRVNLFGRLRHDGDEEVIDKDQVRPETYGIASTSYDGPLELTSRHSDLISTPIENHAKLYHSGQSWNTYGVKKSTESPFKTEQKKNKATMLHLKTSPTKMNQSHESDDETPKVRLIARVPHRTTENDLDGNKLKKSGDSSRFSGFKKTGSSHKHTEDSLKLSSYPSSDKYVGPLDEINRRDDIEQLPFISPTPVAYQLGTDHSMTTHKRVNLFGRLRHDGDEEVIDKDQVRPETYGIASTSYDGPLELTSRHSDLISTPIENHAKLYHSGQSWNTYGVKKSTESPFKTEQKKNKATMLHLKTSPTKMNQSHESDDETPKVRLIARVPHRTTENDLDGNKLKKSGDSSRFSGFKKTGSSHKHTEDSLKLSSYPSSDKYVGPLDEINRRDDIEQLPFISPTPVAYQLGTDHSMTTHKRVNLFGRLRHDGDEEVIDKDQVRPETYGIASTSYDGPLELTSRHSDLISTPIENHAKLYHSGQSWNTYGVKKSTESPFKTEQKKNKATMLHLKTSPTKMNQSHESDDETPKVRLIARVPHRTTENDLDGNKLKKSGDSSRFSGFKKTGSSHKHTEDSLKLSSYPSSDKYVGPLDEINRRDDIEQLPFISPTPVAYQLGTDHSMTTHKRVNLFGRLRHDGDEEVIDKDQVRPETYGIASTSYDGPLELTGRHSDLISTPIENHAKLYHSGQSWNTYGVKKSTESPFKTEQKKNKATMLHLKTSPTKMNQSHESDDETPKVRLIARVPHRTTENDLDGNKLKKSGDSSRFSGFKKTGSSHKHTEDSLKLSSYPSSDKYVGPLDEINRRDDIEQLPFISPTPVAYQLGTDHSMTTHKRVNLFGRLRHDGDEEVIDKDQVRPETYGIASTSYDGPLELTSRHSDLISTPIENHAKLYHSGQSWNTYGVKKSTESPFKTEQKKNKATMLHLKTSPTKMNQSHESDDETPKVRLIARVPHRTTENDLDGNKLKKSGDSSRFSGFKKTGSSHKHTEDSLKLSSYPSSDKYVGPLDEINRRDDIEQLPFISPTPVAYQLGTDHSMTTHKRVNLFGRLRHDGDEEVIDKDQVRPETYGIASTSYDGPLELTSRHSDLISTPIENHAKLYHSGQSWNTYGVKKSTESPFKTEQKKNKATMLHLKTSPTKMNQSHESDDETPKVRLIARVPHRTTENDLDGNKLKKSGDSSLFSGFKKTGSSHKHTEDSLKLSSYPSSDKYVGPLDEINRRDDIEQLPFISPTPVAYQLGTDHSMTTHKRVNLFGRLRHDGDEEVIDKDQVRPETYGIASTSYDGPLELTSRHSDLISTPIENHAKLYHSGQSWNTYGVKKSTESPFKTEQKKNKATMLHLKTSPTKMNQSHESDDETPKVRLIARVPHRTTENDLDGNKLKKSGDSSRFSGFKKTGSSHKHTEDSLKLSSYPSSDKYVGPLDEINRRDDIEQLPFISPTPVAYQLGTDHSMTTHKRVNLFGRLRHDGDEEVIDKDQVRPETYGIASTSYDGPLELTSRHSDLISTPIENHAKLYHSGQSWNTYGVKKSTESPFKTEQKKNKATMLHLKTSPTKMNQSHESDDETPKVRLIARVPHRTTENDLDGNKLKKSGDSSRFSGFKKTGSSHKHTEDSLKLSSYPSSDKYVGPLDEINRRDDIEQLPFISPTPVAYQLGTDHSMTTHKRVNLFGRLRHDGDEEVIDKDQVRPETYGIASTSYDGPLELTGRHSDLISTPIENHAKLYHSGQSWNTYGVKKSTESPFKTEQKKNKATMLHLKTSPTKMNQSHESDDETPKVRLIARVPHRTTENDLDGNKLKKSGDSSRFSGFKKTGSSHKHTEDSLKLSSYPSSDKYVGPLDEINRRDDIEQLPFISPTPVAYQLGTDHSMTTHKRVNLFGRLRHDGDEEVIDKDQVRPETYGIASTSYDGPLELTSRHSDLISTPIENHAKLYHSGQSWNTYGVKKSTESPFKTEQKKNKATMLHLKTSPTKMNQSHESDDETPKVRLIARVPHRTTENDLDGNKLKKSGDSSRFSGFKKTGSSHKHTEDSLKLSSYPSSDKYVGPLDEINRRDDIEQLPFISPTPVAYQLGTDHSMTTHKRVNLFGRLRHDGDEEVIDKDQVRPETYGIASTSYDGPLELTSRHSDLISTPIENHAKLYHSGQSWNTYGVKKSTESPFKTEQKKNKATMLHLKTSPTKMNQSHESDDETPKVRLIARVPHRTTENDLDGNKLKKSGDSSRFSGFKKTGSSHKHTEDSLKLSSYPSSDKYVGPLDEINRRDDIEQLPFISPTPVAYQLGTDHSMTTHKRVNLFGRLRHDGDEEVIDKDQVRPETYGIASTSYDGPLELTGRHSDLISTPIENHAKLYHSGQSWNTYGVKKSTESPFKTEQKKNKATMLHLKTSPTKMNQSHESDDETPKVRLIARVPHRTTENDLDGNKLKKSGDSSRFSGFKKTGSSHKHTEDSLKLSSYPSSDKYVGPLDEINRRDDIEQLPFISPTPVAYQLGTDHSMTTHKRVNLFGRLRHDGDEEVIDKDQVRPETYGIASTSYDGPLELTSRHSDLISTPIENHAKLYHSGQSWNTYGVKKSTESPFKTEQKKNKATMLHLKTSPTKMNQSHESDDETPKVRLIARVPHRTTENDLDGNKLKKSGDSSRFSGFKKTGSSHKHTEDSLKLSSYPSSDKYVGPLDEINRRDDIEQLPFISPTPVAYQLGTDHSMTTHKRVNLFGRLRHDGDEEVIDKDQVRPETYGIASTSYDGPLELTSRHSDLISTPIENHAKLYHSGQSWNTYGVKKSTESPFKTEQKKNKATMLHLKTSPTKMNQSHESDDETPKVRLIARVPHRTTENDLDGNKLKKSGDSSRFSGFKKTGSSHKHTEDSLKLSSYPSSDKYVGPLDEINRRDDIEQLPFISPTPVAYQLGTDHSMTTHKRVNLFGRLRHDGDEEVIDKDQVRPETYGIASTSYDGPLELTSRHSDLISTPIENHAKLYHSGQSWNTYGVKKSTESPFKTEQKKNKATMLHLKTSPTKMNQSHESDDETPKVRLIARVPHRTTENDLDGNKLKKSGDSSRFSGFKKTGSSHKHTEDSLKLSSYPSSDKYVGPLDEINRRDDIEQLPFISPTPVAYQLGTDHSMTTHKRVNLFGRLRHDGDEEVIDKDQVRPETYGIASTSYDGPLELPSEKFKASRTGGNFSHSRHFFSPSTPDAGTLNACGARLEDSAMSENNFTAVHVDRRVEVQFEPTYCLSEQRFCAVSEDDRGLIFTTTPPMLSSKRSLFHRLGLKTSSKKPKKQKKIGKDNDSSDTSRSSEDEKNQVHVVPAKSGAVTLPHYADPEEKDGRVLRRETNELKYHIKGEGILPEFDPKNPSLASIIAEAERLNQRSPRLEHAERTVTVRALAPLPLSYEESGQPHTTISTWQESNRIPDEVTTEYDEKGNKITRTLKTSQVKQTVQKQTFQNYIIPQGGETNAVTVERVREETTPLGLTTSSTNDPVANLPHVVQTHSRSVIYDANPESQHHEDLGEFVSCKTLTSGNRTVETYTYKTEHDGIIETHVEHRVTIHSDEPIDHDAELSHAIMEATQMNPDMTVEKIEVRQESTA